MIEYYELARRYSKALYESMDQPSQREEVLNELRSLASSIHLNKEIKNYLTSPLVSKEQKTVVIEGLRNTQMFSPPTLDFIKFLIQKNRINILEEVAAAYQDTNDEANGTVRGTVRSVATLSSEQQTLLESRISQATGKKAILDYKTNETLIGGLVAQVGSYKFDDSLDTQLQLLRDQLKRRAN